MRFSYFIYIWIQYNYKLYRVQLRLRGAEHAYCVCVCVCVCARVCKRIDIWIVKRICSGHAVACVYGWRPGNYHPVSRSLSEPASTGPLCRGKDGWMDGLMVGRMEGYMFLFVRRLVVQITFTYQNKTPLWPQEKLIMWKTINIYPALD